MAAVWLLALNLGCNPACEGAGCGSLYPAADLHLFLGGGLAGERLDPEADGDADVHGTADEGHDWALAPAAGGVLAGVPDAGEVRRLTGDAFDGGGAAGTVAGEGPDDRFGAAIAAGEAALLVGAPGYTNGTTGGSAGAVYRFDGLGDDVAGDHDASEATLVVLGAKAQDRFGTTVAACGDLDGDGIADWAAAAPWAEDGGALAGSVYVATDPTLAGEVGVDALVAIDGGTEAERFGAALACDVSLDGDDLPELLVGAPYAPGDEGEAVGVVGIWRGGVGFGAGALVTTLEGLEAGEYFGSALAAGDLDGDGVPELVVGAPGRSSDAGADDTAGAVYVFRGSALVEHLNVPDFLAGDLAPAWALRGVSENGRFGDVVRVADLTGDGVPDLLVGAPGHNPTGGDSAVQSGAAFLFPGPSTDWPSVQHAQDAATTVVGDRQYLRTGERMTTSDVDLDGLLDLVVLTRAEGE